MKLIFEGRRLGMEDDYLIRKGNSLQLSCEIVRDFDGTYYANIYVNRKYVYGLPEHVPYDTLKNEVKDKTGIEIPDCDGVVFRKLGRKYYATVSGEWTNYKSNGWH